MQFAVNSRKIKYCFIQYCKGSILGRAVMRIHTNWGPDPREGYRIDKSINIFLITVVI